METQVSYPTLNVLKNLICICKDGQRGFALAEADASTDDLRELFSRMSRERSAFSGELGKLVASMDADPEEEGSTAGALHLWWMDVEAVLTGANQHALLVECERGEDAAEAAYREAVAEDRLSNEVRDVIERQYKAVIASHEKIRARRDSFPS